MDHKFYKNSEQAWIAMFEAIKSAERSIYWECYILKNDTNPYLNFFELLKKKSKNGVKVRIVLDGFASLWYQNIDHNLLDDLRDNGVEVLFFNSWFHRVHRKILIVDEKTAFIGGVNVAHRYRKWLDLHIKVTGRRIVKTLLSSFANSYFYSGGKNPYLLSQKSHSPTRRAELWLLDHFPNMGRFLLKRYYTEKIAMAEHRIILVTPYFAPKHWLIKILKQAALRGVSVEVLIPKRTDLFIFGIFNNIFATDLSRYGIKFYFAKEMNHAKALLVDDKVGLLGSNNIDSLSFDFNIEASLSFEKKDMVKDLSKILEEWKSEAVLFSGKENLTPWYLKPFEYLFTILAQIVG